MYARALFALALALALPLVHGHGFVKDVTVNGQTTRAQKTDIKQSSFRAVSDNTGWIGSNFFSSDCAICGCSDTPGGRVAAPGGTVFADAGQSAGQTPSVKAGDSITLHIAGNPGDGWPHPNGHLLAYLAECPASGCNGFDVRNANFFKIQALANGVPALRAAYDRGADSNPWAIPIPSAVASAKYIMRAEIFAYGQSSQAEGGQVQAYPFCMNLEVTGGGTANPATVKFPAANADDKAITSEGISHVPGPAINQLFGGSGTGSGSSSKAASPAPVAAPVANTPASGNSPAPVAASPPSSGTNTGTTTTKKTKSGRKCKAPAKKQKRRAAHRRHHARNAENHAHAS